jgi:hypothetical protein
MAINRIYRNVPKNFERAQGAVPEHMKNGFRRAPGLLQGVQINQGIRPIAPCHSHKLLEITRTYYKIEQDRRALPCRTHAFREKNAELLRRFESSHHSSSKSFQNTPKHFFVIQV